jgi:hypothetical protein
MSNNDTATGKNDTSMAGHDIDPATGWSDPFDLQLSGRTCIKFYTQRS